MIFCLTLRPPVVRQPGSSNMTTNKKSYEIKDVMALSARHWLKTRIAWLVSKTIGENMKCDRKLELLDQDEIVAHSKCELRKWNEMKIHLLETIYSLSGTTPKERLKDCCFIVHAIFFEGSQPVRCFHLSFSRFQTNKNSPKSCSPRMVCEFLKSNGFAEDVWLGGIPWSIHIQSSPCRAENTPGKLI